MNNNFSNFTNLYEISKTLRFELKPVGETEKLLIENKVFKKDKIINKAYHKIKPFLDKLHRLFIKESLENINLDYSKAYQKFLEIEKTNDKKQKDNLKKEFDNIKKDLRKQIVNSFKITWEKWKKYFWENTYIDEKGKEKKYSIKWDSYKILLSETNLNILYQIFSEEKYKDEVLIENYNWEKVNIFQIFKGFTTYFTNFNHSRENFYLDDWKSGRLATRIIDENMIFFFKNKKNYEEKIKNNEKLKNKLQEILDNYWENIDDFFDLKNYNNCLIEEQIEYYNKIIWWANIDSKKIKWLNEIINLEKQAEFSKYKQEKKNWNENIEFKKQNFPILKELYKQILWEEKEEDKFIEIENFWSLKENFEKFIEKNNKKNKIWEKLMKSLLDDFESYDFSKIYLSKLSLNTISAKFFGPSNWNLITEILKEDIWFKNKNKKLDLPYFISLENIKIALEKANNQVDWDIFKKDFEEITIKDAFLKFLTIFVDEFIKNIEEYNKNKKNLEEKILILSDFDNEEKNKDKQIDIIKDFLDSALNIFRMMKYFVLEKAKESVEKDYDIDDNFYNEFKKFYVDNEIIKYYNEFRNYLTKKPYLTDKIKLNFEKWTLLKWWPDSPEWNTQYYSFIFRKDWKFFLWITNYSRILDEKVNKNAYNIIKWNFYEKMVYKQTDWKTIYWSNYSWKFWNKYSEDKKILSNNELILRVKEVLKDLVIFYPILEKFINKNYDDPKKLASDISSSPLYSIKFSKNISKDFLEKWIFNNWKNNYYIYLFEIYNKDFAEWKTWRENLHTIYFKWLFEENNLKNVVLKLNWQAEIFRREASLKEKIDKTRKTNIDIIEKRRYTLDKLFFHCPIKLNFAKHTKNINQKILNYISKNKEINIIWIDRWEKHLAYYSVIDRNWKVLKDENWNLVKWSFNKIWKKDYYQELVKREEERQKARWSWKTIWTIKELKEGYISQIVHKLAELIIKYNAILVFEDLNSWFKRWRQKIERQVYQKLEKALIEKLNYLTFKDKNYWEKGHYLSAYQLTSPFETFEKVWKQTWIIFYTNPAYTSSTCPKCGFRKDIYLKYINLNKARTSLKKEIDKIYFDWEKFIFEYKNKKVFSNRDRKRNISSEESWVKWWKTIDNNITENLENLFNDFDIDYKVWENLIEKIIEKNEKRLYKNLFYNFNAILNIRNSNIWDNSRDWDFICCPVCDFDSRKDNEIWVENWDDNWAFNIARKWIIILNKIDKFLNEKWSLEKIKWKDFSVNIEDWDSFCGNS